MSTFNRREFLSTGVAAAASKRPNVLVILCDQLNASVISPYGGPVRTPNLERIARRGMTFTQVTCPTPFCSPTRASLVTGLYPHAHGIVSNVTGKDYPGAGPDTSVEEGLTRKDVSTDRLFSEAGYTTHQYGKWHLHGEDLPWLPDQYGEHLEYEREMAEVFSKVRRRPRDEWMDWYGWALPVGVDPRYRQAARGLESMSNPVFRDFIGKAGRLEIPLEQNFDKRVADKTVERLRSVGDKPFVITCSFNTPHDPNVVPSPYYERFDPDKIELPSNRGSREARFEKELARQMVGGPAETQVRELLRIYYACVSLLDDQVGRVLDALEATGRAGDTIVLFTTDHGDMAGGHGMFWKSTSAFYDEIARVPFLVSFPGRVRSGVKCHSAANLTDVPPTLLDLAGLKVPAAMQGRSLAPCLDGRKTDGGFSFSERVASGARHVRRVAPGAKGSFMARGEGWKYCRYPDGQEYLYDLRKDSGELKDLAGHKQTAEMARVLDRWLEQTGWPRS